MADLTDTSTHRDNHGNVRCVKIENTHSSLHSEKIKVKCMRRKTISLESGIRMN